MAEKNSRPNPDEVLARIKAEGKQKKRGRLKIFLGYAAGVGKTYTMLDAARQLRKELDFVVAYVETHGRAETEALLEGLEVIPRKQVEYRSVSLTEMDLDAVLGRRPQLALVDELAHTNAPDSRHPKRYQDVEELLEAGIDVYTTLNVQHIESLQSTVSQITGVWVHETVPDTVIDNAAEIELVDLPPEDLLKRLKEGKVYVPQQIARAAANFFREGNLIALRELSMRTAAQRVDEQMRAHMETRAIRGPVTTVERILVCVRPGPQGNRLVHSAYRLASRLGAEWFAIYVETPDSTRLSPDQQDRLMNMLRLAEQLGGKTATIQGRSVAAAITEYASKNNFTKILVGKPADNGWRRLLGRSVVSQIIRQSEPVDVYLIGDSRATPLKREKAAAKQPSYRWRRYLLGLALVGLSTLLGLVMRPHFSPTTIIMIYLLSVVVSAFYLGLGPAILVSILGVLVFDFFIIPPYLTFAVADTEYVFTFIVLLVIGIVVSYLTSRVRRQSRVARQRESETATLYALSRNLAATIGLQATIRAIISSVKETFGRDVVVFLPDAQNKETLKPHAENPNLIIDKNEVAAAVWSFQHQKTVGQGTDTLPNAKARYLPLNTARGAVGVMALWVSATTTQLTMEQTRLLEAFADLAAVAVERTQLAEEARNAQILEATEKLQTALLNSISHDLRTPLVSIIGVLSSLREEGMGLDDAARTNLIQVATEEAERLNHLITNLLDVSRIEAGAIRISRQPSEVQDIVGVALEQSGSRSGNRPIKIDIPPALPFVSVDFGLIVQALVNILDNALKYSPPDSPIEISGRQVAQQVEIVVADRGIGIPPEDLQRVFDKFYRVHRPDNVTGTGLGLSISKGIVEAHGGRIAAENRPGGGTVVRLTLPVAESGQ
jgi:two-component system, OmpR family, sensor histidine kinase KdpD